MHLFIREPQASFLISSADIENCMEPVSGLGQQRCSLLPSVKVLQVSENRGGRESQADQSLNNFHRWLHSFSLWSVHFSTSAYWSGRFNPPWSLQLTDWLEHRLPHPLPSYQLYYPSHNLLLQNLGLSSDVYCPCKVSVEISKAGSVRRPKPKEAWERRRVALALQRLPSRLFEGEEGAEGKSISKKQEACDGMANRVSALMFQMLGEIVVCLAVLRSSAQPLHKKQQTLGNKNLLSSL